MAVGFLTAIFLMVAGCSDKQPGNRQLHIIEKNTAKQPYMSIATLYSICFDSLTTADQALYTLIMAESTHRLALPSATDSLIEKCYAHYRNSRDRQHRARAALYYAISLYEHENFRDAILKLKEAEYDMTDNMSPQFMFDLYDMLGKVNYEAGDTARTLFYYRTALAHARNDADHLLTIRCANTIADIFGYMNRPDSMHHYIDICEQLADRCDNEQKAMLLTNKGHYCLLTKDTARATVLLQKATDIYPIWRKGYRMLGDIYNTRGDTATAVRMWYESISNSTEPPVISSNETAAYNKLADHFHSTRQYKREAFVMRKLITRYENIRKRNKSTDIISLQKQYDKDMTDRRHRNLLTILGSVVTMLIMVILAITTYTRHRIRRLNNSYSADLQAYNATCDRLARLKEQAQTDSMTITRKTQEIEQLQTRLATYQDDRRQPGEWNIQEHLMHAEVVARMHRMAAKGREALPEDWNEMRLLVRQYIPTLMAVIDGCDTINDMETNVCLLIRLRFIPSEIATLTGTSPQTTTNMRVRMLAKIFGEKGGARDFDARIRAII